MALLSAIFRFHIFYFFLDAKRVVECFVINLDGGADAFFWAILLKFGFFFVDD